jgi:hypothetical protein
MHILHLLFQLVYNLLEIKTKFLKYRINQFLPFLQNLLKQTSLLIN